MYVSYHVNIYPGTIPIPPMYGIFTNIYHKKSTIHVGKYTVDRPMDGVGFQKNTKFHHFEAPIHGGSMVENGPR